MFPALKPIILNSIAGEITGHPTINQGISLTNFFSQEVIDKIAEYAWGRFWTIFTTFGTTSAGLIGLIIVIRGIQLIADTIIHGYALHRLFGWSLHLLGAFWDSVTNLLLHLGTNRPPRSPTVSHQPLLTASEPKNSKEAPKSSTHNENTNSGKDHNITNTNLYPHSELKEELRRTHTILSKSNIFRMSHVPFTTLLRNLFNEILIKQSNNNEYLFHVHLQYKTYVIMSSGKDQENAKQKLAQNLYNTLINELKETNQNV